MPRQPISNELTKRRSSPGGDTLTHAYAIAEPLKWLTGCVFAIISVHLALNIGELSQRNAQLIALTDLISLSVLTFALVPLVRGQVTGSSVHWLGVLVNVVTVLNIVCSELIRRKTIDVIYVPFVIIGTGAILLSPLGYTIAIVLTLAVSIPTVLVVVPAHQVASVLTMFFAGVVISASVFASRVRSHSRVVVLRERDQEQTNSLQSALLTVEEQFREHRDMQERRQQLEDQLRQAQKLEAIGVLAGGVAHDMNNVLGAITSVASLAIDRVTADDSLRQDLDDILSAARRGSTLTRNLLGFARQGTHVRERFQLGGTVQSVMRLMKSTVSKQIELLYSVAPDLDDVEGDAGQMSHALMNLCINGVDAVVGNGRLSVTVKNRVIDQAEAEKFKIDPGRYVEICIEDTGSGIAPEVLPHVFEPFFSTKSRNERSGLGLSMVYGTVKEYGGDISIQSTVGHGTRVTVLLPSRPSQIASERPASVSPPASLDQRRCILLVDDEPMLRSAGKRLITAMGFEVITAANGAEGAAAYRQHRDQIALVILDVAMPVMSGVECFRRLRELNPDVCVLVASGFAKHGDVDALLSAGAAGYLGKPYDRRELYSAIRLALNISQSSSVMIASAGLLPPTGSAGP